MTNDQANAANVLECSIDLIRQILIKHETAVIAEFKSILEAKKHELELIYKERDECRTEIDVLKTQIALERIDQGKQRQKLMMDRDNAWNAFQRLRKAYAMVRYPTLNEEIKLLYDSADAVANGKDTSGDGRQNPAVTSAKLPDRE